MFPHNPLWFRIALLSAGLATATCAVAAPDVIATDTTTKNSGNMYVALLNGPTTVADSDVTATYQCAFCAPLTVTKRVNFYSAETAALRAGFWLSRNNGAVGIATEFSRNAAHGPRVDVRYDLFSILPAFRFSFLPTASAPAGQLHIYGGAAISMLASANVSVSYPEFPRSVNVNQNFSTQSTGAFLGGAAQFGRYGVFIEQRVMNTNLSGRYLGNEVKLDLRAQQTLFGVSYAF